MNQVPAVEFVLRLSQILEVAMRQDFGFEAAMGTLVLAVGLWGQGPAVRQAHARPNQPDRYPNFSNSKTTRCKINALPLL
jgi:hypothetical protein